MDSTELPSSSKRVFGGSEEQRALMKNLGSQRVGGSFSARGAKVLSKITQGIYPRHHGS